jgi:hypothetical protein
MGFSTMRSNTEEDFPHSRGRAEMTRSVFLSRGFHSVGSTMPPKQRPKVPCPEQAFEPKKPVEQCPICSTKFGIATWKHNCHMCGWIVCDNCSKSRLTLPPVWTSEPVRVCDPCLSAAAQLGGKAPGEGRILGGGSTSEGTDGLRIEESPEERRAKMLAARQQSAGPSRTTDARGKGPRQGPLASSTVKPAPVTTTAPATSEQPAHSPGEPTSPTVPAPASTADTSTAERQTSTASVVSSDGVAPMNPVLAAAMRRKQAEEGKLGRPQAVTLDPQRIEMLHKVQVRLRQLGRDEPFGLSNFDRQKLQTYLRHLNEGP